MAIACGVVLAGSSLGVAMPRLPSRGGSFSSSPLLSLSPSVARIPPSAMPRPTASARAVKESSGAGAVGAEEKTDSSLAIPLSLSLSLSLLASPHAQAAQELASDSNNDPRGLLLLGVLFPAIAWVLFNILQPALNQINKMRSGK